MAVSPVDKVMDLAGRRMRLALEVFELDTRRAMKKFAKRVDAFAEGSPEALELDEEIAELEAQLWEVRRHHTAVDRELREYVGC